MPHGAGGGIIEERSGIEARYPTYNWEGRLTSLRKTAMGVRLLGWIFLLAGVIVTILAFLSRLPVPASQRFTVIIMALVAGVVIFAVCVTLGALLTVALEMEEQMRHATNIWRILEERDQTEETKPKNE
ncbi:MAG: hypothetical protein LUQ40_02895 [Methanomicrobiales archaeon]|nr:hypothetical protein [Methanomicrobiales archaeon]